MELRQLEYLVAVAEEANFTRAANRVHISQSGVSAQIRQLEHELGATLLDRSGRAVTVTAAGAAALGPARAALAAVRAVRLAVDDVTGLVRGRLVVGMVVGCTVTPLFDALAAFQRDHPGIELALFEDNSDRLIDAVRTGEADLALVGAAGATPAGVSAQTVVSERLVAAVPKSHPLARRRHTTVDIVSTYPLVCLPAGTGVRAVFDQACAERGLRPEVVLQASAPAAIADLARRGLGVAILSESMLDARPGDLSAAVISDITTKALLALIWRPAPSPALRELVRHARSAFA